MIEIKVPTVGESINEVTLVKWLKNDGDYVQRDEVIAELESEKATFEVNAEQAGVLKTIGHEGDTLNIGDVLAKIDEAAAKPQKSEAPVQESAEKGNGTLNKSSRTGTDGTQGSKNTEPDETKQKEKTEKIEVKKPVVQKPAITNDQANEVKATPLASAMIADKKINPSTISPSGIGGKILKDDVME
ncbi:MAG TPA: biotin/lipoyl-containing protein, partial [Chitinophagaceae bacterium]|nr:biotin/lipoyl-containing protein [Chitinophagaceae bacterium]